jgi:hypothetical protein
MGSFLKYTDLPIFANFTQQDTAPVTTGSANHLFAATDASISLDPSISPNRYLGKPQNRVDFSPTGPMEGKFSLTFHPLIEQNGGTILNVQKTNQLSFFDLTGDFSAGHQIKVSNFLLKQCYLQSYSVKINAFQPVVVSANFVAYDISQLTNTQLAAYTGVTPSLAVDSTKPYYEVLHGLTTLMDAVTGNLPSTKTSIEIQVDCQRTPVYALGSKTPSSVILNTVERTTTIQGENIGNVVDVTGANAGATNLYFLPLSQLGSTPSAGNKVLSFDISGRVTSQQISISQGSIMNGKVVIKEALL